MPYLISSDRVSTRALYSCDDYIAHSISWGKHRYVRREGTPGKYRYIYPEDLKTAGSRLVTGAKNLASRAASTASSAYKSARTTVRNATQATASAVKSAYKATGFPQGSEYRRAFDSSLRASGNVAAAKDPIKTPELGGKNDPRRSRAIARSNEISKRAQTRTNKAWEEYRGTFAKSLDDAAYDIAYAIQDFAKSKIGVDGRRRVRNARDLYVRFGDPDSYTDEYSQRYFSECARYGETFLGTMEKLLRTKYASAYPYFTSDEMLTRWAGQSYYR